MNIRYLVCHGTVKPINLLKEKFIKYDGVLDRVEELTLTKRPVLKVSARLQYYPLGFASQITVLMKRLL